MNDNVSRIIEVSNNLYNRELVSGKAGNVSARLDDAVAITPTLKSLNDLEQEDVVLVDMDANVLTKGSPSSEVGMHLEIYKRRSDVNAIVHTHSPYATGFSFSSKRIKRHEGFGEIKNPYFPFIEYEKPGSKELAVNAGKGLSDSDVLILKRHGVICVGENLRQAESLALFVEETAKTQFITYMLNSADDII